MLNVGQSVLGRGRHVQRPYYAGWEGALPRGPLPYTRRGDITGNGEGTCCPLVQHLDRKRSPSPAPSSDPLSHWNPVLPVDVQVATFGEHVEPFKLPVSARLIDGGFRFADAGRLLHQLLFAHRRRMADVVQDRRLEPRDLSSYNVREDKTTSGLILTRYPRMAL